ncbi:Nramp family divalent metal transporter [Ktedonobacter robiniae]|uniref:Divalent metal cation transporter MntH n=1 Tax=Ktedonobacter robiniae TaxID=2778365 RepID=A0ABQ3UWR1_9CHLR|nr:Nramp family divalent metal transporter [Ktedonobacter robiniae]GHO57281.1 divalent metal cation transporter MntH [Ktedonobacter robiniae]
MSSKPLNKLGGNFFSRCLPPPSTASDDATVLAAQKVLKGKGKPALGDLLPFLGPAFIASVAYVDPGNFATNIQGGAEFGYLLVWVIIASNLMAMLIQALSAKLGIATGHNLAEMCREHFPRPVVWGMWVVSEVVAIATDMAEFLGAALGFTLLFHIPLLISGLLTAICTILLLSLQRRGFRPLEAVITVLITIIALCYLLESIISRPDWGQIGLSVVTPRLDGTESLLLAVGILGATVMPHVIFLHSSLTQKRIIVDDPAHQKRIYRFEIIDVIIAMGIAGLVNMAMLIMAASTFHTNGLTNVASIEEAYRTLRPLLGNASSKIFGISLLASGLSSSVVGTMAGQVVMQGFLKRSIHIWIRRLVTMLPALIVIAIGLDPTRTLVISQVVLSFGIPFALVPLVIFTSQRKLMKNLVNHRITTAVACIVAGLIIALNLYLLTSAIQSIF